MKIIAVILALSACAFVPAVVAAPVVITNENIAGEAIDADTIKAVFRGKKVSWANKSPVVIAVLDRGGTHERFLKEAFNISSSAFANHWRLTVMSGGGVAPRVFASEQEPVQFVAQTPGAIGYVDEANATPAVHRVAID